MNAPTPTSPVRTRFAPSPTGTMHLGALRTALFTWLWARHNAGDFILRIEDTDSRRFEPSSIASIISGMKWLGLDWDEGPDIGGRYGPYTQSERGDLYRQVADDLLAAGHAYRCFCTPERLQRVREAQVAAGKPRRYDRTCRYLTPEQVRAKLAAGQPFTVRLAMPTEGSITFPDLIRGDVTVDAATLQDPVILKSDGMALYHLAVVVDDHFMDISHVLRGQEWLATAPYHFTLYRALGWTPPVTVHLPVILNPNGKGKMSKRKPVIDGQAYPVHVHDFINAGYLPDAMFNFLSLLGWTPDAEQELFQRDELIERFDIARIVPSAAAMPYDKLTWMNGVYIRALNAADFRKAAIPLLAQAFKLSTADVESRPGLDYVLPEVQARVKTLEECPGWLGWMFCSAQEMEYTDSKLLIGRKLDVAQSVAVLDKSTCLLETAEAFTPDALHRVFGEAAKKMDLKAGSFFGPVRGALSGKKVSPPLFAMMAALGRDEAMARVANAKMHLHNLAST